MSKKTFFVFVFAALAALAVAEDDTSDDGRCDEVLGNYKHDTGGSNLQIVSLALNESCSLETSGLSERSYLEYAQYYNPSCTRPVHFTSVTFVFSITNNIGTQTRESCSVIFRSAVAEGDSYVPGGIIHREEFENYIFAEADGEFTFPVNFRNLFIYLLLCIYYFHSCLFIQL